MNYAGTNFAIVYKLHPKSKSSHLLLFNWRTRILEEKSPSFIFSNAGYAPDFITGGNEITAVHKPRFDTEKSPSKSREESPSRSLLLFQFDTTN